MTQPSSSYCTTKFLLLHAKDVSERVRRKFANNYQVSNCRNLPCVNIKVFLEHILACEISQIGRGITNLAEEGDDDSAVSELSACQGTQGLGSRLVVVVFDVDLANTGGLSATSGRTGDLHLEYVSVLAAFLFDVFDDF